MSRNGVGCASLEILQETRRLRLQSSVLRPRQQNFVPWERTIWACSASEELCQWGQDCFTQFWEHFWKDTIHCVHYRLIGSAPWCMMCILCVHLRLSDCRKYSPHSRLRLQCCVYPPAGHHHSTSHSHESFARAVSCISKFCTHLLLHKKDQITWLSLMVFLVLVARVVGRRGMPPCPPAPPGGSGPPASQLAVDSSRQPATSSRSTSSCSPNNPWSSRSSLAMKISTKCILKETTQSSSPAASTSTSGDLSWFARTQYGWKAAW